MNTDPKINPCFGWYPHIPLGHCLLHFRRTAESIDDTAKLDQHSIAGGFDDPAMVLSDFWIDEFATQSFEAFEGTFLIRPHQPRIAGDIGSEDCGETAGLAHSDSPAAKRRPER
jgi:hypothetical protein